MFTGLIQSLGTLQRIGTEHLRILCDTNVTNITLQDLAIGDSIAVDGVCLTVVEILPHGFIAAASPETLSRTTLGRSSSPVPVNLEASLRVGSKLGGHFVTGHVDGIGYLQAAMATASSWELSFTTTSAAVTAYIVAKGSVAVNGISLTIADCNAEGTWFKVAVIPHTYEVTNLHLLQPGSSVNLEADILGKYVEKFMQSRAHLPHDFPKAADSEAVPSIVSLGGITPEFLAENGYS